MWNYYNYFCLFKLSYYIFHNNNNNNTMTCYSIDIIMKLKYLK